MMHRDGDGDDTICGDKEHDELHGGEASDDCDGGPGTDRFAGCEQVIDD
jgi:Ca2+-binding RTX toxin-like protein